MDCIVQTRAEHEQPPAKIRSVLGDDIVRGHTEQCRSGASVTGGEHECNATDDDPAVRNTAPARSRAGPGGHVRAPLQHPGSHISTGKRRLVTLDVDAVRHADRGRDHPWRDRLRPAFLAGARVEHMQHLVASASTSTICGRGDAQRRVAPVGGSRGAGTVAGGAGARAA